MIKNLNKKFLKCLKYVVTVCCTVVSYATVVKYWVRFTGRSMFFIYDICVFTKINFIGFLLVDLDFKVQALFNLKLDGTVHSLLHLYNSYNFKCIEKKYVKY